jgi:hypothetical protein
MSNTRPNILVVCPGQRDRTELAYERFKKKYQLHFYDYNGDVLEKIICKGAGELSTQFHPQEILNAMDTFVQEHHIEGVLSSEDYPGSIFASILAQQHNFISPSIESILTCQHKYYSRIHQQLTVPEAAPQFQLLNFMHYNETELQLRFPVFLKPVKSYFSVFANKATSHDDIRTLLATSQLPSAFLEQFDWFIRTFTTFELGTKYLLAEEHLSGQQVTYEGLVHNGECNTVGIVDSIMYPGTICFERFEYPSSLPQSVQIRMAGIANRFMHGIGFNNGLFNIEFMYNPTCDTIHIIEVNPRLVSQFADLYEKVDGLNNYDHKLNIITGTKPTVHIQHGAHAVATGFVLRTFEDKRVHHIPTMQEQEIFYTTFPDGRFYNFTQKGNLLSDTFQDGKSFRYALIHLGAQNTQELAEKFEHAKQLLPYRFSNS